MKKLLAIIAMLLPLHALAQAINCPPGTGFNANNSGPCSVSLAGFITSAQVFNVRTGIQTISGTTLNLIPSGTSHVAAALIYQSPLNIQAFTSTFTFIGNGNNVTFTLQNNSGAGGSCPGTGCQSFPGGAGGEAGCSQAANGPTWAPNHTVCLELDFFDPLTNAGAFTFSSAQLYQPFQVPFLPVNTNAGYIAQYPTTKLSTSPVSMTQTGAAGTCKQTVGGTCDTFSAKVVYDGSTVTLSLFNVTAGGSCPGASCFTQTWTNVSIPSIVGSNTAYVTITGGTGTTTTIPLLINSLVYTVNTPTGSPSFTAWNANSTYNIGTQSAASPVYSVAPGTYSGAQSVAITTSRTPNNYICYVLSATTPSFYPQPDNNGGCTSGTLYTAPVSISSTSTLYAMAGSNNTAFGTSVASPTGLGPPSTLVAGTFTISSTLNVNPSMSEATIQGIINGGNPGDTVSFAAGTYNLASNGSNPNSAALVLKAGLLYTGPTSGSPAHLVGTGLYPLMYFTGTSLNIQYITFDNGLLFLEDHTTSATIDNDVFENMPVCNTTASQTTALFINGGINNSDISFNTFSHIGDNCNNIPNDSQGAGAIGLFAFHNLTITHNTFDNVHEGIDVPISTGGSYDCAGGVFDYNTFTNVPRMGIELLGTSTKPSGLEVAFNNFSQPLNPYFPSFGFSLTAGQNMIFHDNVSNSNSATTGPYGVEIAGVGTQAYNNTVEGNWAAGFSIGNTTAISIFNNKVCGPNMNANPSSGSTPSVGNANGFISWQGSAGAGPNTFTGNTTSASMSCTAGTVTLTTTQPPYGWLVMPGSARTPVFYPGGTGATTKLLNYSVTGGAIPSCTTNCLPEVTVTMPATGGTCSVSGSVGSYVLTSTVRPILTATSVDDNTKSVTVPFNVCDTTTSASVDVEPSYQQAYGGQKKTLQSYVIGYTDQSGTWSITTQPGGGDGALVDTTNRDTQFSATVTGRYVITYTSAHGPTGTAIVYLAPTLFSSLGYAVTPNKTIPTPCVVDPALTGTDYEVGAGQAFANLTTVPFNTWTAGSIVRIHQGTYANAILLRSTGTPTQPLIICGMADTSGNLPVIDGFNATENAIDAGTSTDGTGGIKMTGTSSGFSLGYELGSVGPDYLTITGLEITRFNRPYSYFPAGSATLTPYTGASGIWVATSQHLHVEGVDLEDDDWGILANSNTGILNGRRFTQFHQVIGSHINNFSHPGSFSNHGLYMEGLHTLVEGTLFEHPQYDISNPLATNYDNGDFIKMRGGDSIIRYNLFRGILTDHIVEYPDMEDTIGYIDIASNLGQPGSASCGDSAWCTYLSSNGITLPHLAENMEALAKDYYYGNAASNEAGKMGQAYLQVGSFSAVQELSPTYTSPGIDRSGRIYVWSNTFDQPAAQTTGNGGVVSTANYNTGGFVAAAQFVQPTVFMANNVWWSDPTATCATGVCFPFSVNVDATITGTFQTNMAVTGAVAGTGTITGGTSAGWGNYTNTFSFPLASQISNHISGVGSANFLTTASIPYNRTTFAPVGGSALINAGSQITLPEIAKMPVRFQPLNTGYMVARTDSASSTPTIGAVQTGSLPTFTAALSPSPSTLLIPSAGIGQQQNIFCTATFSDGTTSFCQYRAQPWGSTNSGALACFGDNNPACNINTNGSGNLTTGFAGLTPSVAFTVGSAPPVVANPTCTPPGGTYTATQVVTCSTVTSASTICGTIDGSTPTATTAGVCSHGTSGPFTVSSTLSIKVLATKSGFTNSGVVTAPYTINPLPAPTNFVGTIELLGSIQLVP